MISSGHDRRVKKIIFTVPAQADVRRIDRETAMRILAALHRFAETGEGDVKKLQGESANCACASAITACASPKSIPTLSSSTPSSIAARPTANARPILSSQSVCVLDSYHCPLIPHVSSSTRNAGEPGCPTHLDHNGPIWKCLGLWQNAKPIGPSCNAC